MKKLGVPQLVAGLCIGAGVIILGVFYYILDPKPEFVLLSNIMGISMIIFGVLVIFVIVSMYIFGRKDQKDAKI